MDSEPNKMEYSLSALTYKASIPVAILESKKQKKLFVVYISGSDADSVKLEISTWTDSKVAESLSKYCILLHILDGSSDAVNFCAIYPQKSVPSIAVVGYNGVQLWQSEGFVSAEVLASSLEKTWLSLHIQETTATVLTATLASKKRDLSISESSDVGSSREGNSSTTVMPSPSVDKHAQSLDTRSPTTSEMIEEKKSHETTLEEKSVKHDEKTSSKSLNASKSSGVGAGQPLSPTEESKGVTNSLMPDFGSSTVDDMSYSPEDGHPAIEKILNDHSAACGRDSQFTTKANEFVQDPHKTCINNQKADTMDNKRVHEMSDVHLNIRLPSGVSLQDKFSVTSTLRMIKAYVDRNQASSIGSYNLAIPYPRKVFSNQDLSRSLAELGLFNRQGLIVVPNQRTTSYHRGGSSSHQTTTTFSDSSNASTEGYFAYAKRMLSYINPLSYLGGSTSSSSSGQAQTGMWEYNPNPALQNSYARTERPCSSRLHQSTVRNDSRSRQLTSSRSGSNIHTLKHDEDDSRFNDRNSFWNGNSTQYGGNSDDK